jgi:hypothetical protein
MKQLTKNLNKTNAKNANRTNAISKCDNPNCEKNSADFISDSAQNSMTPV